MSEYDTVYDELDDTKLRFEEERRLRKHYQKLLETALTKLAVYEANKAQQFDPFI